MTTTTTIPQDSILDNLSFIARTWLNVLTISLAVATTRGRRRLAQLLMDLVTILGLVVLAILAGLWLLASKLGGR
jgi:hypothetical protein